jgi:hypothetical protein
MTDHPDAAEMRERYARMTGGRRMEIMEGLVMLTGLYLAISPWVVHFGSRYQNMRANDLILGLALAAIGWAMVLFPERAMGLGWMLIPIGIWLIISPWVATATHSAPKGIIWSNVIVGALACALGAATMAMSLMRHRSGRSGSGRRGVQSGGGARTL